MTRSHELQTAYVHNLSAHKIGETDGFSEEQAADLGFETYDRAVEIASHLGEHAVRPQDMKIVLDPEVQTSSTDAIPKAPRGLHKPGYRTQAQRNARDFEARAARHRRGQ